MSNIFSTNNQNEHLLRASQRAAARPDVFGVKRPEQSVAPARRSSVAKPQRAQSSVDRTDDFLKAANDARDAASVLASSREAAGNSSAAKERSVERTPLKSEKQQEEPRATDTRENNLPVKDAPVNIPVVANDNSHDHTNKTDNTVVLGSNGEDGTQVVDDNSGAQSIATPDVKTQSEEGSAEFVKTLGLGGFEAGLLNAYLSQHSNGAKADNAVAKPATTAGKVTAAYETITANLNPEEVELLGKMASGEVTRLVNAKAGAYATGADEGGGHHGFGSGSEGGETAVKNAAQSILESSGAVNTGLEEALGKIGGAHTGDVPENIITAALVAEDGETEVNGKIEKGLIDNASLNENIGKAIGLGIDNEDDMQAGTSADKQGAGKDGLAAAGTKTLKQAYVQAHTEEKGVDNEEGEEGAVQKTTEAAPSGSAKKGNAHKAVIQPAMQSNLSIEELTLDLTEAVDSAEVIEAVAGDKDSQLGAGLGRGNRGDGGKQDLAAMKNDIKAEAVEQTKDSAKGIDAVKKTTGAAGAKNLSSAKLQQGVFDALDRGVRLSLTNAGQVAKLTIRPESLGEMRIKLSIGEDGLVQTKIMVDNSAVKSMLDADGARLKDIFNEQGLTLDSYSVEVGNGWSGASAKRGGDGFNFQGRGSYSDAMAGEESEVDSSLIADNAYGLRSGAGLDLFA